MTTTTLTVTIAAYLALLVAVVYFTRARPRRIVGALIGGAVAGVIGLSALTLCERMGLWRIPNRTPQILVLVFVGFAVSLAPFYLISWRVARRFGWRGLTIGAVATAIVGPIRDYAFAARFPDWIVFSPGFAPMLAVSITYVSWAVVGHAAMRLVAGPAPEDTLRGQGDVAHHTAAADR